MITNYVCICKRPDIVENVILHRGNYFVYLQMAFQKLKKPSHPLIFHFDETQKPKNSFQLFSLSIIINQQFISSKKTILNTEMPYLGFGLLLRLKHLLLFMRMGIEAQELKNAITTQYMLPILSPNDNSCQLSIITQITDFLIFLTEHFVQNHSTLHVLYLVLKMVLFSQKLRCT